MLDQLLRNGPLGNPVAIGRTGKEDCMKDSCVYKSSVHLALVVVFFIAITAQLACATTLTPGQLTDLMVENQGDNAEFIGVVFGPDASSPLAFSSNVNPAGTLFSFSLI